MKRDAFWFGFTSVRISMNHDRRNKYMRGFAIESLFRETLKGQMAFAMPMALLLLLVFIAIKLNSEVLAIAGAILVLGMTVFQVVADKKLFP